MTCISKKLITTTGIGHIIQNVHMNMQTKCFKSVAHNSDNFIINFPCSFLH